LLEAVFLWILDQYIGKRIYKLQTSGFKSIQKSVWLGDHQLQTTTFYFKLIVQKGSSQLPYGNAKWLEQNVKVIIDESNDPPHM